MKIDRRQWLSRAGLASAATLLGGIVPLEAKSAGEPWFPPRPIIDGEPIRLSANENPYGPSQKVRQSVQEAFDVACRYPSASRDGLLDKIAKKEGLSRDHIVITGGSTEGLKVCGLTFGMDGGEVITAAPTFKALYKYAEQFGAHIHEVPVREDMQHDLAAMEQRITNRTSLVFVCNPNNPTGTLLPADEYTNFCKQVAERAVVFADEAYFDFITEKNYPSMTRLVKEGHNVIVSKTFSKVYGLAGLRIGYLVARPDIAQRLIRNRVAYTNVLALHAASTALDEQDFYDHSLRKNEEAKAMIYQQLDQLGLPYVKSHTNFVFFQTGRPITEVQKAMLAQGVSVGRPFPPFLDWCRISTGTIKEMEMFNQALRKVMG
jgi:histidinol-phosphate aminotransferase